MTALKRLRTNEALEEELRIANLRLEAADKVIEAGLIYYGWYNCDSTKYLAIEADKDNKKYQEALVEYKELSK